MAKIQSVNAETTKYGEMKDIAKFLEIPFVGKSKTDLANEINAEIQNRGGEIEMENIEQQQPVNENEQASGETNESGTDAGNEASGTETTETVAKWYENGYGNQPGDRVTIIGKHVHQSTPNPKVILVGREAEIVGPSKKKDMVQAILIDPKTGEKQGCINTLAFGEYADKGTVDVAIPARRTRKKAETATETPAAPTAEQPAAEGDKEESDAPAAELESGDDTTAAASETDTEVLESSDAEGTDSEQQAS